MKYKPVTATIQRSICIALAACLVAACTPHQAPPVTGEHTHAPADFPEAYYLQKAASGSRILRIDAAQSLIVIRVRRAGALARLGHDHVVASHHVTGFVDMTGGLADLYVPLQRLVVDEPELRAEAGFASQLTLDAIEGTRRNMLDKVLESGRYPFALVHIRQTAGNRSNLSVTVTLHGTIRTFEVPAQIEAVAGGVIISGQMSFNQTDFGIIPFSILGGALQVLDHLDLRFRITATDSQTPF